MVLFTADPYPRLEMIFDMKLKTKGNESEEITAHEFIGVKGYKAKGKRLSLHAVKKIAWLDSLQIEEPDAADSPEDPGEEGLTGISGQGTMTEPDEDLLNEDLMETDAPDELPEEADDDQGLKFRLDAVETLDPESAEVNRDDESPEQDEINGIREPFGQPLLQPGQPRKKRPRIKKQDPTAGKNNNDDDPGETFQMELPL